ncbi:PD-(D/E)XK motif protein [Rhizobium leguminosarum]|uniref:PD-(D/E)XK motif protein n=1 Tax=Rhizobium ruizarguesonis TaxID=2081791 RepID=UPI0013B7F65D|nr:PD-(D/E)XK motif protein [Rhizobium ruizarguesonis]NEI06601.1 PD-(D/E)XK motif protein [Rhizobium ruizarguesonis]
MTSAVERSEPSAIQELDLHLADAGYDPLHDYSAWRWLSSEPAFHTVADHFPRLAAPVPLGVSNVTYALSLSACAAFRTDWDVVRAKLFEEGTNERA